METGKLCWFDFATKDEAKAMPFFKAVLAWEFDPSGPMYWTIKAGKEMIGGLRKEPTTTFKAIEGFTPYFTVPSVTEGRSLVTKWGGKLVGEVTPINEGKDGHFQNFRDLDGNLLSLWSAKP